MIYRREIDGLRTVAVLPVLLSHAGYSAFSGGYIGVDVFFVISGFLITRIILDEIEEKRFSVARFYERRARRILPASFLVMIATLIVGAFLMSADAFQNLGQSVVATTLFSNNILLTMTSGYWEMESQFKPLLHTWSLGVEEQYYFVVPLFLWVAHRFAPRHVKLSIALIAIVSFALCLWSLKAMPVANFYLLHTRAWELAIGGLASTVRWRPAARTSAALALAGLALIVFCIFGYTEHTPVPSAYTLLPVIGAALVLMFGQHGPVNTLLGSRPMVGIGLISYSTYLWHQPLFALARVARSIPPTPVEYALMIVASIGLAYLTWRFVEAPFRDRRKIGVRMLIAMLLPVGLALIVAGGLIHRGGGFPQRFDVAPGAEPAGSYKPYNMSVHKLAAPAFSGRTPLRMLVIGNSTARDFVNMAQETNRFPKHEIIYRDNISICDIATVSPADRRLIDQATTVVLPYTTACVDTRPLAAVLGDKLMLVGPMHYGPNLNPFTRLKLADRQNARIRIPDDIVDGNRRYRSFARDDHYIDVIAHMSADGRTSPIFDEAGRILSEDRVHITRSGARYVGKRIFADPRWNQVYSAATK